MFYNALFDVQNSERLLRIGMTAKVSITLGVGAAAGTKPLPSKKLLPEIEVVGVDEIARSPDWLYEDIFCILRPTVFDR